ncbi:MAG: hypothetical protein PVF89_05450, partial [Lysobacterales bacterium]
RTHTRHHTPYAAIMFYAAVGCGFALSGTFQQLAVLASGSILLVYLGVCLAVLRLRQRFGPPAAGEFRIPGGATVPLIGAGVVVWLLSQMEKGEAISITILLFLAAITYTLGALIRRSNAAKAAESETG